jgi:hypothetical protein
MLPLIVAKSAHDTGSCSSSDLANLQVKFRVFILFSFFLLENLAGGLFSHRMANIILIFLVLNLQALH